jgi:hypothetical protein
MKTPLMGSLGEIQELDEAIGEVRKLNLELHKVIYEHERIC